MEILKAISGQTRLTDDPVCKRASGLMIPKVNRLAKLSRALWLGTNDEVISSAILNHDKRVCRETPPITHTRCLPDNIIAARWCR